MGNLYAFLHPEKPEAKEIIISSRFKDEAGNVVPFKIRPITAEENDQLIKANRIIIKTRSGEERKLDSTRYQRALIVAGTVEPSFADAQLCQAYGVVDPQLCVVKMLYAGEYQLLADAILKLSGLDEGAAEQVEAEAKN
jgi:hypothetical protein